MNSIAAPKKSVLKAFFRLLIPFWKSEQKWKGYSLLAAILTIVVGNVYAMVQLNEWNKAFYDAIQNLNQPEFYKQLIRFLWIALIYIFISTYRNYLTMLLQIRWRNWMTGNFIDRWLANKNFYYWQITGTPADNPDQRITEDVQDFINLTLDIFLGVFREFLTLASFITILWKVSGSWIIPNLFGYKIEIYSYMVWACLVYAVLGTWLTNKIGSPLIGLTYLQQKLEADFRYYLIRLRENSESVALADGEDVEKKSLVKKFSEVVANFKSLADKHKQVNLSTNLYAQMAHIFPFIVAAPRLFSKQITMGQLFQINSAFGQVQGSFSFVIDYYKSIVRWKAVIDRLASFQENMDELEKQFADSKSKIKKQGLEFKVSNLNLRTPNQIDLLREFTNQFKAGEDVVIQGPSGVGKSTLFRSLVGLWPHTSGELLVPEEKIMVVPQKPYMPIGSFKSIICYPSDETSYNDGEISKMIHLCRLSKFESQLHDHGNWSLSLSPGEQQRVSFARVLLQKPKWLLLDEATSALDEDNQEYFYQLMKKELPKLTIISIAHRESVKKYHSKIIDLGVSKRP